jgi:hypothetical protein
MGIPIQGIFHDLSKFNPSEFVPAVKYFQGDRTPLAAERDAIGYSYAWRNHKGKNKHHWQWYVDMDGWEKFTIVVIPKEGITPGNIMDAFQTIIRPKLNPAPIPDKYIKEMYCDMLGAAKAYGKGSAKEYYLKNKNEWVLHPDTKIKFENMLGIQEEGKDK